MKPSKIYDQGSMPIARKTCWFDTQQFLEHEQPNLPVFLYAASALYKTSRSLQLNFPGEVSYAVKANPEETVLNTLWDSGIRSFDVASINEIKWVSSLFRDANLHFNNPVKSERDIEQAYCLYGVRSFVIDDLSGLNLLIPYLRAEVEVTIRFKLDHDRAAYDFGSKFGATSEQAIMLLKRVNQYQAKCALTFHPGSQCTDSEVYERYIIEAARIARKADVSIKRLNVGGGFPVNYQNSNVAEISEFFHVINQTVKQCFPDDVPGLLCEPGRAMVSSCASLLTRVIHLRDNGDVFINDGVYGGLQEQSIMAIETPLRIWRNGIEIQQGGKARTIFGPTCDPVDRLLSQYPLSEDIKPGDYVEFGLMGAYGSATATGFNGFDPAEYVWVEKGFEL